MNSRDKDKPSGQFVNDLLRTEFHKYVSFLLGMKSIPIFVTRKFMAKFIKVLPVLLCSLSATDNNLSSNLLDIVFRIACTVVVFLSNSFDGRTVIHMIPSEKCLYYYSMAL